MAEEFQAGICGENWWSLPKNMFMGGSSPCYTGHDYRNSYGSCLVSDAVDHLKPISCKHSTNMNDFSVSDHNSAIFQDSQKRQQQTESDLSGENNSILMDISSLQMMGFGVSSSSSPSSSSDWSCQTLLQENGRGRSYSSMLREDTNSSGINITCQIQKESTPKRFTDEVEDSTINAYTAINQDFSLDHQQQQRLNLPVNNQSLSTSFSSSSVSYGYPSTTIIQGLFEPDLQQQPHQSLPNERKINYSSSSNYGTILNGLSSSCSKLAPLLKPSFSKPQQPATGGGLHFSNNIAFWSASGAIAFEQSDISQPQYLMPMFEEKPNCSNLATKPDNGQVRDLGSVVNKGSEPAVKRPRIETPSPLPTFKVRKEKLGDRITALQQLVSPFGKTDIASVLHEAIEYIKFLHDQVNLLSTPYMKKGNDPIHHQQKETEGSNQDLTSRGLCLVPISSTFPVANETTTDCWTPTFCGNLR